MLELRKFFQKQVELIDVDDARFQGFVTTYTPAIDTDEGIEEIGLLTVTDGLVSFKANEVKLINEQE